MSHGQCSCPGCGTILRVRDRSFVGRQIQCPECHVDLLIGLDDAREFVAVRPKAAATSKPDVSQQTAVPVSRIEIPYQQRLAKLARSPLFMAWALAMGLTLFAAVLLLRPSHYFRNSAEVQVQVPTHPNSESNEDSQPTGEAPQSVSSSEPANSSVDTSPDEPAPRTVVINPDPPKKDAAPSAPMSTNETDPSDAASALTPEPAPKPDPIIVAKERIEGRMKQLLKKVVTSKPVSRFALIELLEDALAEKIHYNPDELGEKNLERTIEFSLEDRDVGQILKYLLDSAGWDLVIDEGGMRLKPRQVAGPKS